MIDIKRDIYGIDKKAFNFGAMLPTYGNLVDTAGNLTGLAITYLAAAALISGTSVGWTAAKSTAKGKQDFDTAQKGYENEALSSDIGNLTAKIRREREARKSQASPKSMRVFG